MMLVDGTTIQFHDEYLSAGEWKPAIPEMMGAQFNSSFMKPVRRPIDTTLKFGDKECLLEMGRYITNNRLSVTLVDAHSEETLLVATQNVEHVKMARNEVAIKTDNENEGILDLLIKEKIVEVTGRTASSGWGRYPIVKVLTKESVQ